jgi:hypothetical protein
LHSHITAVVGDGRDEAAIIELRAIGIHAHPLGDPGLCVADKDVRDIVGIARDQVVALERKAMNRPSSEIEA